MNAIEKFMALTLGVVALALVLTNPQGATAAGGAAGGLYQSVVGAFFKPNA